MRFTRPLCCAILGMGLAAESAWPDELVLSPGLPPITSSATIKPGRYRIDSTGEAGAIRIIGDGITVDFRGAELVGADKEVDPDAYQGRGIVIYGKDVVVKNVRVRGYKIGIYAERSPNLTVQRCDVSRNFRQRLASTPQREDLSDWLYGHENDENQWLRYGAGIYLFDCPGATIKGCRARNGQNGICLVSCDRSVVVDNDMSFMSGWGIALWRTSHSQICNNNFDWCMRGYSHGVYSRGQDSAGILVYEQCSDNVFAYNSATHGGDGFFLYAGNETVRRTGTGGCNRNLIYRNDFSHAAANGIESTFSDGNIFIGNILDDCTHGIWAGYSYNTIIARNHIADCANGISIEHGQNNLIAENVIKNAATGVHLWWDDDKDLLDSVFGKQHDRCPSTGNHVLANQFHDVQVAVRLADDRQSLVQWSDMSGVQTGVHLSGRAEGTRVLDSNWGDAAIHNEATGATVVRVHSTDGPVDETHTAEIRLGMLAAVLAKLPPQTVGSRTTTLAPNRLRGRRYIFIDEWGPYDFADVRLFPDRIMGGATATVQILAGGQPFTVGRIKGSITVSPMSGTTPATITIAARETGVTEFTVPVEVGGQRMRVTGSLLKADWKVRFFRWNADADPRENQAAWDALIRTSPLFEKSASSIDFVWGGGAPGPEVPPDRFGTVASTSLDLPAGRWVVSTISDDGIRVWIDSELVIDDWTWHAPKENTVTVDLSAGSHTIRVEHFEIDGHAQLQLTIQRAP